MLMFTVEIIVFSNKIYSWTLRLFNLIVDVPHFSLCKTMLVEICRFYNIFLPYSPVDILEAYFI